MLVLVTGPPAAGKTSLALPLARALALPLLSKDAIKEAIHDSVPASGPRDAWSRYLSDASYRVLLSLLRTTPSAVLDLNLPAEWASDFAALTPQVQVFCRCPQPELERRLVARATARHPAHLDDALLTEVRTHGLRGSEPAPLDCPLLEVETTGSTDVAQVVAWVRRHAPPEA